MIIIQDFAFSVLKQNHDIIQYQGKKKNKKKKKKKGKLLAIDLPISTTNLF